MPVHLTSEADLAGDLAAHLGALLGERVRVRFGRSRTKPVQARWGSGTPPAIELRLAGFFAGAPAEVRDDLAAWLRSGRRARAACARLDAWIDAELAQLEQRSPRDARAAKPRPEGQHLNLEPLARSLLAREFRAGHGDHPLEPERWPAFTWGRRGTRAVRHSLRLGSWVPSQGLVRVHAVLDQPAVPDWFVRYILFHELLHVALPPIHGRGSRWIHHHAAFRASEREYTDHDRAQAWQAAHLDALITSARTGRAIPARSTARRPTATRSRRTGATAAARAASRWCQGLFFTEQGPAQE